MNKQEFFNEAFEGYNVSTNIRNISESICREFNINGICDPMYISNVIAVKLGLGDGCGNFSDNSKLNFDNVGKLAERLKYSYGCNINNLELVINIITGGFTIMEKQKNTLIFEGAGSEITSVGNCRIRTRIRNIEGRLIYLEINGFQNTNKTPNYAKGLNTIGHVDCCFYADHTWDTRNNSSSQLSHITKKHFEYNKENILKIVNEDLYCNFNSLEVVNKGLHVYSTEDPLCDCAKESYTSFKEVKVNINILKGVQSQQYYESSHLARYALPYEFVKEIPSLKNWMQERTKKEQEDFKKYNYYTTLVWDKDGNIYSMEISARQNFVCMSFGFEQLESVIKAIKEYN